MLELVQFLAMCLTIEFRFASGSSFLQFFAFQKYLIAIQIQAVPNLNHGFLTLAASSMKKLSYTWQFPFQSREVLQQVALF